VRETVRVTNSTNADIQGESMSRIETITELRTELVALRDKGTKIVSVDALLESLPEEKPQNLSYEQGMEVWREQCKLELAQYETDFKRRSDLFHSVISSGQTALRSAILINGGAAVICFPLLEKLLEKGCNISGFANTLGFFVSGVLFAAMATGTTYFAQRAYASEGQEHKGHIWQGLTVTLVVASYALFVCGAWSAWKTLVTMNP